MPTYVFFWKPTGINGIYSQWYESEFEENGTKFNCAEQYMMYHKALLFGDKMNADRIMDVTSPAAMRRIGRAVRNFNDETWAKHRKRIVKQGNYLKFTQNPHLLRRLLSSKTATYVEASPKDRIWGIGYTAENAIKQKEKWGTNLLGKILTELRNELLQEAQTDS
jgi:ribA/ribD-fused uncharacterized protein